MSGEGTGWVSGSATRVFPVAVGTPMAGYAARTGPSIGVSDELTVGAIVLEADNRRVGIVSADVAAVDDELVEEIAAASGLERAELVVCASHTHSGPAGVVPRLHPADADQSNPAMRAAFIATCAAAIEDARGCLEPVDLLIGKADTAGLAANRNDPDGPFDPRLTVLATRSPYGDLRTVLVHFACHPTILSADSRLVSADFPGTLRRALRTLLSGQDRPPEVHFLNGAAGDISSRYTRKGQDKTEVERVGNGLANAAAAALLDARSVKGRIEYGRQHVDLEPRALDGEEVESLPTKKTSLTVNVDAAERRRAETRAQGAMLLERLRQNGSTRVRTTFDVEAWTLGHVILVAVPGEFFASLGASVVAASPSPTLVLGYANGYVGYLPDHAAYASGTYEALASPFAAGAGEHVARIALNLVRRTRHASMARTVNE